MSKYVASFFLYLFWSLQAQLNLYFYGFSSHDTFVTKSEWSEVMCVYVVTRHALTKFLWWVFYLFVESRSQELYISEQNIIKQLGTLGCVGTGHESHYSLLETNSSQLVLYKPLLNTVRL